ncbi:hypothetical protein FWK35_00013835 [Aphis craccivora]|uniref:Uncharacterized protein n=1 Tax=Aphis craccivora TaxID=307492 RepID=A0A6G0YDS0_APHCR|nr:hypothetical protein FWK35_00013835 [Aphis craccivora]
MYLLFFKNYPLTHFFFFSIFLKTVRKS